MTQQLHLWDPGLGRSSVPPAVRHFAIASAGVVLMVLAAAGQLAWLQSRLRSLHDQHAAAAQARLGGLSARLGELERSAEVDPAVSLQLEAQRQALLSRQSQLVAQEQGLLPAGRRFSDVLRSLASQTPPGVVLTDISIATPVRLAGHASSGDVLNEWLVSLERHPTWAPVRWTHLSARGDAPVRPGESATPAPAARAAEADPRPLVRFEWLADGPWIQTGAPIVPPPAATRP